MTTSETNATNFNSDINHINSEPGKFTEKKIVLASAKPLLFPMDLPTLFRTIQGVQTSDCAKRNKNSGTQCEDQDIKIKKTNNDDKHEKGREISNRFKNTTIKSRGTKREIIMQLSND